MTSELVPSSGAFSRSEYNRMKEEFCKQYQFEKVRWKVNPYTNTRIETWHDYMLYVHCHVIKKQAEMAIASQKQEVVPQRISNIAKKDPSAPKLATAEKEIRQLSHQKKVLKLLTTALLVISIALCCVTASRPSKSQYESVMDENEALSQKVAELETSVETYSEIAQSFSASSNNSAKNSSAQKENTSSIKYIGNKSTKKFHLPSCGHLPSASNRISLPSRATAINKGYSPCGHCNP